MAWPACGSATCFFAAVAGLAAGFLVAGFLTAGFLTGGGVADGGICILEWSISWAETGADASARPIANAIVAKRNVESGKVMALIPPPSLAEYFRLPCGRADDRGRPSCPASRRAREREKEGRRT